MSTAIANPSPIQLPPKAIEEFSRVESIAAACSLNVLGSHGHFTRALVMAKGIKLLREAITPQMMGEILSLQGTSLGFRTDKDKEGGYDVDTVKECAIEAALRGGYWVGNEFNIIAARTYMTKEFFTRACREFPGLTDLKLFPGVPKMIGDSGALVPYSVTWKLHGTPQRIDRMETKLEDGTFLDERICVRVNKGMGADAVLGKAERKILAAVYKRITGSDITDGEADPQEFARPMPNRMEALTERLTSNAPTNGNGNAPSESEDDKNVDAQGEIHDAPQQGKAPDKPAATTDPDKELREHAAKAEALDALADEIETASTTTLSAVNAIVSREIAANRWTPDELKKIDTWAEAARSVVKGRRGDKSSKQGTLAGT